MTNIRLIQHQYPNLSLPEMICDTPISKYLNRDLLLKNMNKSFCCGLIGKSGSGKTSLLTGLIQTKNNKKTNTFTFNDCFDKIYVFMPSTSRASIKNNIFGELPEDQLYEGLNFDILSEVYEKLLQSSKEKERSLLILDDVQSYYKDPEVEKNLLHLINNRRHLKISIFIIAQNYTKIGRQIRMALTDLFVFNVSKEQYADISDELVNIDKKLFEEVLKMYKTYVKTSPKSFLYFNVDIGDFFIDWNEIQINDE